MTNTMRASIAVLMAGMTGYNLAVGNQVGAIISAVASVLWILAIYADEWESK